MSEAIASKLESIINGHKINADDADWLRAALSQPAPSAQPAVPVVSDEQIRKTVESIQDPDTVPAFHNGYYTLTPDELRRSILAMRPAVEPMTEWEIADIFERWDNTSGASMSDFVRMVEAHHGITAKAEGGA